MSTATHAVDEKQKLMLYEFIVSTEVKGSTKTYSVCGNSFSLLERRLSLRKLALVVELILCTDHFSVFRKPMPLGGTNAVCGCSCCLIHCRFKRNHHKLMRAVVDASQVACATFLIHCRCRGKRNELMRAIPNALHVSCAKFLMGCMCKHDRHELMRAIADA